MHRHDWLENRLDLSSTNATVREKDRALRLRGQTSNLERCAKHAVAFEALRAQISQN